MKTQKTTAEVLVEIYTKAEKQLKMTILKKKITSKSPALYEKSLLKQIQKILKRLRKNSYITVNRLVNENYKKGLKSLTKDLEKIRNKKAYNMFNRINTRQIEIIARNVNSDLNKATKMIGRRIEDEVRQATIEATAEKLTTGQTVKQMQKNLEQTFYNKQLTSVEYSNGTKMPIGKYAEMTARSTTAEAQNSAQINQAKDWGYDLMKMTSHSPTCAICAKYQGRVYATTKEAANGKYKDKYGKPIKFPYLYDTALSKGYETIHPNCRHRFSVFAPRAYTTEELKETSRNSTREFEDDRTDAQVKAYAKEQAEKRRKNANVKQYEKIKAAFPNDSPKSFAGFMRMKNTKSKKYNELMSDYRKLLSKSRKNAKSE